MSTVSGTAMPLSNPQTWFTALVSSCLASASPEAREAKPRVLVIDDEGVIRELLSLYLGSKGLEVATVRSADGARAVVEQGQFDLVILDWKLEAADGLELAHLCKVKHSHIPVIIFTGTYLAEGLIGSGCGLEADAVVRKGGPLNALSAAIFRSLGPCKARLLNAA
jgi:CheY-like chemotaxis protein